MTAGRIVRFAAALVLVGGLAFATAQTRTHRPKTRVRVQKAKKPAQALPAAKMRVHVVNRACPNAKNVVLVKIVQTSWATIAYLEARKPHRLPQYWITSARPHTKDAFLILDAKTHKHYPLTKAEGIAVLPDRIPIVANQVVRFKLFFPKLPATVRRIHLVEGTTKPAAGATSWRFMNIDLK